MNYRRLGRSGLKVSELSFGSWVTYGNQVDEKASIELMSAARDHGVTAEFIKTMKVDRKKQRQS